MDEASIEYEAQIIGEQYSYRTPFWIDQFNWAKDITAQRAALAVRIAEAGTRLRRVGACAIGLIYLLVDVVLLVAWLSSTDENNNGGDQFGIPFGIMLVGFFPLVAILLAWVNSYWRSFNRVIQQLQSESVSRYEEWKISLNATDPNLLFQVLHWEQNQRALLLQQQAINAAQEANRLARMTAENTRRNAQNTAAIRSELNDPRWGQFGANDFPK